MSLPCRGTRSRPDMARRTLFGSYGALHDGASAPPQSDAYRPGDPAPRFTGERIDRASRIRVPLTSSKEHCVPPPELTMEAPERRALDCPRQRRIGSAQHEIGRAHV